MIQPAAATFGQATSCRHQDLPKTPFDRHVYGVAAIMRDKSGKLSFRGGQFGEFKTDARHWRGDVTLRDIDVFTVTPDVLQAIAVDPKLREGINLGQYVAFGSYFTDDTRDAALASHQTIVQAMIRTPEGPVFGKRGVSPGGS